ncbi:MAG: TRM11 family SAM-dependent methyltransferase [Cuniculiplasma sp.]|jgi:DNA modification methylase
MVESSVNNKKRSPIGDLPNESRKRNEKFQKTLPLPISMKEVSDDDYFSFVQNHSSVRIEDVEIEIGKPWVVNDWEPTVEEKILQDSKQQTLSSKTKTIKKEITVKRPYQYESYTVWSFPTRGTWATHKGNYRGNWSPFIPRNLIKHYVVDKMKSGDDPVIMDQMCGSGTTLVEAKIFGIRAIGVDVNPDAIMVARDRLNFKREIESNFRLFVGDARNLNLIEEEEVDFIATHPPYAGIIPYSKRSVEGDLSAISLDLFVREMGKVAKESWRVLKPGKHCAILIGDTRRHQHYVPISTQILEQFLNAGFILREDIIKMQHNMKTTRERWGGKYDFYKINHEHLFVFRKPLENEKLSTYKASMKWR